jgi:hypothetical protein
MFATTRNKGFHITFDNGWTVSVQFGPGNYCEHHYKLNMAGMIGGTFNVPADGIESVDAEIAAWPEIRDGVETWYKFPNGSCVQGNQNPAQVLAFLNKIARKKTKKEESDAT